MYDEFVIYRHCLNKSIEYFLQAVIQVKVAAPKKETKTKTPVAGKGDSKPTAGSSQPKPVKRPTTGKKPPASAKKVTKAQSSPPREQELSDDEVDMRAEKLFASEVLSGMFG